MLLVPMGHDPDPSKALSIYILCCVGVLFLSFFHFFWLFWACSALSGPLFFQENICCALTKDQCSANIFLKKRGVSKNMFFARPFFQLYFCPGLVNGQSGTKIKLKKQGVNRSSQSRKQQERNKETTKRRARTKEMTTDFKHTGLHRGLMTMNDFPPLPQKDDF